MCTSQQEGLLLFPASDPLFYPLGEFEIQRQNSANPASQLPVRFGQKKHERAGGWGARTGSCCLLPPWASGLLVVPKTVPLAIPLHHLPPHPPSGGSFQQEQLSSVFSSTLCSQYIQPPTLRLLDIPASTSSSGAVSHLLLTQRS